MKVFEYRGRLYPDYIRRGNASQFIAPAAKAFCQGRGLDVGSGGWPLEGAHSIDNSEEYNANRLPAGPWDYIFSSHCLEHLKNPIETLEYWKSKLRGGGVLFLYLPHPDMEYWLPQNNRKHLHSWSPQAMAKILVDLGFYNVIHTERDAYWSFAVIGFVPEQVHGSIHRTDDSTSRR